jgi:hypothetical protein
MLEQSILLHKISNDWMKINNELDMDVEGSGEVLVLRYHPGISLEGLRKTGIFKRPGQIRSSIFQDQKRVSVILLHHGEMELKKLIPFCKAYN